MRASAELAQQGFKAVLVEQNPTIEEVPTELPRDSAILLRLLFASLVDVRAHDVRSRIDDVLDAIKIDLKGFSEHFYRDVCGAALKPVLRSIRQVARSGRHLEIVNLMIPTLNDDPDDVRRMCTWIRDTLSAEVPLHFTRFHPAYKLTSLPPTPIDTLERAAGIAEVEQAGFVFESETDLLVENLQLDADGHPQSQGPGGTIQQAIDAAVAALDAGEPYAALVSTAQEALSNL